MTNLSGLSGKAVSRKGGPRSKVKWRARLFMADRIIHPALIQSVYKTGFALHFDRAVPLGVEMNVEFSVQFGGEKHRIRVKATVDYCLLRSTGDGADVDIITTKIGREDSDLLEKIVASFG